MTDIALAVHGGAGPIERATLGMEREVACRKSLAEAVEAGAAVLRDGGGALDAVEAAVVVLEDSEHFNAGRGSVLSHADTIEMDAAVMTGADAAAGAVAGLRTIRNPVCAARLVMERTPHVLLCGIDAEMFARAQGLPTERLEYFVTPHRREQLRKARDDNRVQLEHDGGGTVGAVARDMHGHLAAATSTGGKTNKLPGRVSDSACIGAGTWADDTTCAVSATGDGEAFIRAAFAHEVDARVRLAADSLADACAVALERVAALGGRGGCVTVDARGNVALPFNTSGMYRGWLDGDGNVHVAIFPDDAA